MTEAGCPTPQLSLWAPLSPLWPPVAILMPALLRLSSTCRRVPPPTGLASHWWTDHLPPRVAAPVSNHSTRLHRCHPFTRSTTSSWGESEKKNATVPHSHTYLERSQHANYAQKGVVESNWSLYFSNTMWAQGSLTIKQWIPCGPYLFLMWSEMKRIRCLK